MSFKVRFGGLEREVAHINFCIHFPSSLIVTIKAKKSFFGGRGDLHPQLFSTTRAGCLKGFRGCFPFRTSSVKISPYSGH
jgi:hypothetical protein